MQGDSDTPNLYTILPPDMVAYYMGKAAGDKNGTSELLLFKQEHSIPIQPSVSFGIYIYIISYPVHNQSIFS